MSFTDDFGLVGTAVPRRTSAKDRAREEQSILNGLRQEGFITKPVQKATSGLSFEVVAADLQGDSYLMARKPPARLAKLEKKAKKKRVLTEEELKAKMERVERKRQVCFSSSFTFFCCHFLDEFYPPPFSTTQYIF